MFPDTSSQRTARYTSNQLSFGVGGPFVQDQSFWFVSANGSIRTNDINTLLNANDLLLERSNAVAGLRRALPRQPASLRHPDVVAPRADRCRQRSLHGAHAHGFRARRPPHAHDSRRLELVVTRCDTPQHTLASLPRRRHAFARRRPHGVAEFTVRHRHHQRGSPLSERCEERRAAVPRRCRRARCA